MGVKRPKNDLSKVRFDLYKHDGLEFTGLRIEELNKYVNKTYRKDGNDRKPTTLLKENGWIVTARIWDENTGQYERRSKNRRGSLV